MDNLPDFLAAYRLEGRIDLAVGWVAARQEGAIGHEQLIELGMKPRAIARRLWTGRLYEVHRGVYAVGHPNLSERGRFFAALIANGDRSALSYHTAAYVHGLVDQHPGPIHVTHPGRDKRRRHGIESHCSVLRAGEVRRPGGLRVTSRERALLDLAPLLTIDELTRLFLRARRKGMSVRQLERLVARYPRRPGTPKLRQIIARHREDRGVGRGDYEDAFWAWLLSWLPAEVERPVRNATVDLGDGVPRQADLLFRGAEAWVELDYDGHHGADPIQTMQDHKRDRAIRDAGWELGRYSSEEFERDRAAIEDDIRRMLGLALTRL